MSSPSVSPQELMRPRWQVLKVILHSRWTFWTLQLLDLLTTLLAFHLGAFEVNPLVAQLTKHFGPFRGVLISKLITVVIALGVKRLVWVVNLIYAGVICWNLLILFALSFSSH